MTKPPSNLRKTGMSAEVFICLEYLSALKMRDEKKKKLIKGANFLNLIYSDRSSFQLSPSGILLNYCIASQRNWRCSSPMLWDHLLLLLLLRLDTLLGVLTAAVVSVCMVELKHIQGSAMDNALKTQMSQASLEMMSLVEIIVIVM